MKKMKTLRENQDEIENIPNKRNLDILFLSIKIK